MKKERKKNSIEREYKTFLEKFYERHKWYQHIVFLSRITRMILYLLLGISVIFLVLNKGELKTLDTFIYDLVATTLGKIIAIIFGLLLIIYGIEKPRG